MCSIIVPCISLSTTYLGSIERHRKPCTVYFFYLFILFRYTTVNKYFKEIFMGSVIMNMQTYFSFICVPKSITHF